MHLHKGMIHSVEQCILTAHAVDVSEPIKVSYLVDEIAHFNWLCHVDPHGRVCPST